MTIISPIPRATKNKNCFLVIPHARRMANNARPITTAVEKSLIIIGATDIPITATAIKKVFLSFKE